MELMFVWAYVYFYQNGCSTEGWGNGGNLYSNYYQAISPSTCANQLNQN